MKKFTKLLIFECRRKDTIKPLSLIFIGVLFISLIPIHTKAEFESEIEWEYTYGLDGFDFVDKLVQTSDGGFVVGGRTSSWGSGGNCTGRPASCWPPNNNDIWILKIDVDGKVEWNRTFGKYAQHDETKDIIQTSDGGFALLGQLDKRGEEDVHILLKTDSNGNQDWNRTLGGPSSSLIETTDGFALLGNIESPSTDEFDIQLVKTDSNGQHIWNNTFGGQINYESVSFLQTDDEGFVVAYVSGSDDDGNMDSWLLKTDASGNQEWNKTYGGTLNDKPHALFNTTDGGFLIIGSIQSTINSEWDSYLWKTDGTGVLQLNKTLLGVSANFVVQATDADFVLASFDRWGSFNDFDLVKIDSAGEIKWEKVVPLDNRDSLSHHSIIQLTDGGLVISGNEDIEETDDLAHDNFDLWLVKTVNVTNSIITTIPTTIPTTTIPTTTSITDASDNGFLILNDALVIFCFVLALGRVNSRIKRTRKNWYI